MGYMELELGGRREALPPNGFARAPDPAAGTEQQRVVVQRCREPSTSLGNGEEAVDKGSAGCCLSLRLEGAR